MFEEGSAVRARLLDYGRLVEKLHVIVFAKRSAGFHKDSFPPNVFLYPTQSCGKIFHIPYAIMWALKMKRQGVDVDVVTTQDPFEAGLAGYIIACIFRARLHVQIHTDVMSPYFADESFLNLARVCLAKYIISRANAVRVVSAKIKESIEGIVAPGVEITILPIIVETKNTTEAPRVDLKKKYPQFDMHILMASRLSREKNIESAIEAMHSVVTLHPKAGLIIVGSGAEEQKLKNLVNELGLEKNVMFEGWQDDLRGYYGSADVFVLTSRYEGYGMTIVEALIAGCPVISTDVGCAREVIKEGKNGLIIPVGDTKALADALGRVASGNLKFAPITPVLPTKEQYLAQYKESWENALA